MESSSARKWRRWGVLLLVGYGVWKTVTWDSDMVSFKKRQCHYYVNQYGQTIAIPVDGSPPYVKTNQIIYDFYRR